MKMRDPAFFFEPDRDKQIASERLDKGGSRAGRKGRRRRQHWPILKLR